MRNDALRSVAAFACASALAAAIAGCSDEPELGLGEERVAANEPEIESRLIELTREITRRRAEERGDGVVRRFNQPKTIGCVDASFVVDELPAALSHGLFARPGRYPATLRFANATHFDDREADLRGLSIKVRDVPGATTVGGTGSGAGVQDFTLNSYPALFAGTPEDFLSFVEATADDRVWWYFFNPLDLHLGSLMIVLRARDKPATPLAVTYHSTTPYRYGDAVTSAVKYVVRSCSHADTPVSADGPDYLRAALAEAAGAGRVCLDFMVQFQTDPDLMPIEDASVVWPEEVSSYQAVARLEAQPQDITTDAALGRCENLRFNPWNGLPAHRPLGGINRVRRNLYYELGAFRVNANADTETDP